MAEASAAAQPAHMGNRRVWVEVMAILSSLVSGILDDCS
jgi:hypothetical protein